MVVSHEQLRLLHASALKRDGGGLQGRDTHYRMQCRDENPRGDANYRIQCSGEGLREGWEADG